MLLKRIVVSADKSCMSTSIFHVRYESPNPGQNLVLLSGPINEKADILNVRVPSLPNETSLCIDTGGVSHITSSGTRDFARWSRGLKEKKITFTRCPKVFIDQLNMMPGFIPLHSAVLSFYVPFRTEEGLVGGLEEEFDEKHVLYTSPANFRFENGKVVLHHFEDIVDKNGKPMEMDVVPGKYFRFLDFYCPKGKA